MARCSVPAPPLRGCCVGQRERRRGSPKRSGGSGVAGTDRHGDILVEGGSGGVATSSGAFLRLEAEATEGTVVAASEQRRKHGAGEKNPADGGSTLLKGGRCGCNGEGVEELGDGWGGARERGGGRVRRGLAGSDGVWGERDRVTRR
jgi:hypothetical protein